MAEPHPSSPFHPRHSITLLRCLIIAVIGLILLTGLIALIFGLAVRPKPLEYTVENAQLHGFNITSGDALNATFNLSLRAYNRNRHVSLYYDSIDVTVWYSDQMVAFASTSPFYQPRRNVTVLSVSAAANGTPLMGPVAAKLKRDRSRGKAEFEVVMRARVRFKVGVTKTSHDMLKVLCSPVVVSFAPAKGVFDRRYCDVYT